MGVIPGSMASPGFVVRGRGAPESPESASNGAGRRTTRRASTRSNLACNRSASMLRRGSYSMTTSHTRGASRVRSSSGNSWAQ